MYNSLFSHTDNFLRYNFLFEIKDCLGDINEINRLIKIHIISDPESK